jgi:hypothetical protein
VRRIETAQRLLSLAARVSNHEDFRFWQSDRALWINVTIEALKTAGHVGPAEAFERSVRFSTGTGEWFEDLPEELARLRDGVELLKEVVSRISDSPPP